MNFNYLIIYTYFEEIGFYKKFWVFLTFLQWNEELK